MTRDARVVIDSGEAGWEADTNTNFEILLDRPIPVCILGGEAGSLDEGDLESTFPAAGHKDSLIIVKHTVYGRVWYHSNGTSWRPWTNRFLTQRTITGNDSMTIEDIILVGSAGGYTLTLPTAATFGTARVAIVRDVSGGGATITPGSGNINGAGTLSLGANATARILSNGTNFFTW